MADMFPFGKGVQRIFALARAFDDEDEKPMSGAATTAFSALAGVLAVFLCLILFMVIPTAAIAV